MSFLHTALFDREAEKLEARPHLELLVDPHHERLHLALRHTGEVRDRLVRASADQVAETLKLTRTELSAACHHEIVFIHHGRVLTEVAAQELKGTVGEDTVAVGSEADRARGVLRPDLTLVDVA